jgi:ribosomal protein L20
MENMQEFTTGRQAVQKFKKREDDRMKLILDVAASTRHMATEVSIFMMQLNNAGFEIRRKADGL